MLRDFSPRLYQETILATAIEKNTLVVLPTGLGKTFVFLMLAMQRFEKFPDKKILFLGPTRPLITQYHNLFVKHTTLDPHKMAIFTGQIAPAKRENLWKTSQIIFSTPQGVENDVINKRISLEEVSLLGIDEAHRAVGQYSYVWIAKQYQKVSTHERILALTASPGSNQETIKEVCTNLGIEDVEIRTDEDPDVAPYIKEVSVKWVHVSLPDSFKRIKKYLDDCFDQKLEHVMSIIPGKKPITKREMLALQSELLKEMRAQNYDAMRAMSYLAEAMKIQHAIELLESQGIQALVIYLEDLQEKSKSTKTKAVKNLVKDLYFKSAYVLAKNLLEEGVEHPKHTALKKLLQKYCTENAKIIVFSQYRDSISAIYGLLNTIQGVHPAIFVGQAKKKGMGLSQKEQLHLIQDFKDGKFNTLIMSSVGEEGLDIPAVDAVIFYEPVPSAIRTIQRRGRTGRQSEGAVFVLVAKGTRDEAYRWSSHHKEIRMKKVLQNLKKSFAPKKKENKQISDFVLPEHPLSIIIDYREKGSAVMKKLHDMGIDIRLEKLDVGDFLISHHTCVEYKTMHDFLESLMDKRLFGQLKSMTQYPKRVVIVEGEEDIFSVRNIHPNAIRGFLISMLFDYQTPIMFTKNADDTAYFLAMVAKREQNIGDKGFTKHSSKPLTLKEQQEYLVSALPGVGPLLAKPLLSAFGSVKDVMNATKKQLTQVELIGEKKASAIREVLDSDY